MCHRVQLGASLRACSGVYLKTYSVCTWERKSSRLGVYNRVQSRVYFRGYFGVYNDFGACNEMHVVLGFQVCSMQHDE